MIHCQYPQGNSRKGRIVPLFLILVMIGILVWPAFASGGQAWAADSGDELQKKGAAAKAPAKPKLKSVKSAKTKQLTVQWKTVKNADGYQIRYTSEDVVRIKTVKAKKAADGSSVAAQTATLTRLWGGREYTVKVRSYRKVSEDKDGPASDQTSSRKLTSSWSKAKTATVKRNKWSDLQDKYLPKDKVQQLIFVKYLGNSQATLLLYTKVTPDADPSDSKSASADPYWKKVLSCDAYVGQNGIDKKKEGDRRTPTGSFTITHAFGVKKDPGSRMDYLKLKDHHYWCGDREHYNQLIDIRKDPHDCRGEHLISYTKQYAYAMALNYNKKCTYGKGSAIFLHCFGYNPYTLGCVAVSRENMKTILKTCGDNTKICIYTK